MTKKILHILFAAILVIFTIGLSISKHYCNGKLIEVSIINTPHSCCGNGHCDCCQNTITYVHLDKNYTKTAILETPIEVSTNILFTYTYIYVDSFIIASSDVKAYPLSHPPSETLTERLSLIQRYLI